MKYIFTLSILMCIGSMLLLPSCTKDKCANVSCQNGGSCANGVCNCPQGWTGSNCSQQVTPSQILITKLTVIEFPPENPAGDDWNLTEDSGHADIYPVITDAGGNTIASFSGNVIDNAYYLTGYFWIPTNPVSLTSPNNQYTFTVYNHNTGIPDDNMGSVGATLYSSTNNFPDSVTLTGAGGLKFGVNLKYIY